MRQRIFIDCEFDGHNGPLLSIALVCENGRSIHIQTTETARDPWVIENVLPVMSLHGAQQAQWIPLNEVGPSILHFIGDFNEPIFVADSPVDIGRLCTAITTNRDGGWQCCNFDRMEFFVENVDCYPTKLAGAIQHNAWWDAMALREKVLDQ